MLNLSERARAVVDKAAALGYVGCGIISVSEMAGYGRELARRMERFPEAAPWLAQFGGFAELQRQHPWAKSVVVCARWYGAYRIPANLHGLIAKYYLVDSRKNEQSPDYRDSVRFEEFLLEQGLRTASARDFSITAVRWAAMRAGIGIIRKNNFFYTERGSWTHLEAWLIDQDLEYVHTPRIAACPDNCTLCVQACPTGSLAEAYAMNPCSCISYLTTWDACLPGRPHNGQTGAWLYGCDLCQDACPRNRNAWSETETFPGLDDLAELSLERVVAMDYDAIRALLSPRFWYISKKHVWKWKANALNALYNTEPERCAVSIAAARRDEHENVRLMADWLARATGA